jgi:hypothetical protein
MNAANCDRLQPTLMSMLGLALLFGVAVQPALAQDGDSAGAANPPAVSPSAQEVPSPADVPSTDVPADPAKKDGFFDQFFDKQDGQLDFSSFLAKGGFVPIPIIITEPAVDNGFGLAAAFISVPKDRPREMTRTAIAAFKTGTGSWGAGAFRSGYAFDGRLNYKAGIGHGKITLEAFPAFAPEGSNTRTTTITASSHRRCGIWATGAFRSGRSSISASCARSSTSPACRRTSPIPSTGRCRPGPWGWASTSTAGTIR